MSKMASCTRKRAVTVNHERSRSETSSRVRIWMEMVRKWPKRVVVGKRPILVVENGCYGSETDGGCLCMLFCSYFVCLCLYLLCLVISISDSRLCGVNFGRCQKRQALALTVQVMLENGSCWQVDGRNERYGIALLSPDGIVR